MNNQKPIPDGTYIIQPDGCAWMAAYFRGGKLRGLTEESNHGTHAAARDDWADVYPRDDDVLLDVEDPDLSVAVALAVRDATGSHWPDDGYGISVSRPAAEVEETR